MLILLKIYVIIQKTMSPGKSDKDVMIEFCKFYEEQKQSFADVLQNFTKLTEKHLCQSLF